MFLIHMHMKHKKYAKGVDLQNDLVKEFIFF